MSHFHKRICYDRDENYKIVSNDMNIKDKLRLAICMSQSEWSGLVLYIILRKILKSLIIC